MKKLLCAYALLGISVIGAAETSYYQSIQDTAAPLVRMFGESIYKNGPEFAALQQLDWAGASWHKIQQLSEVEQSFLSVRKERALQALSKFLGAPSSNATVPTVGISLSGGGYRAMICTSGFMQGLERLKILDGVTYTCALSGSTWFVAPWISLNARRGYMSVADYNQSLLDKIRANQFDVLSSQMRTRFNHKLFGFNVLWPRLVFKQPLNAIDIYGALLADVLLADFGDKRYSTQLVDQLSAVETGRLPWPLYTAVSMHKVGTAQKYHWYEFSPSSVRNVSLNYSMPLFAFGAQFANGLPIEPTPTYPLSTLMGLFGSAFTVNAKDIQRMTKATVQEEIAWYHKPAHWFSQARDVLGQLVDVVKKRDFATLRTMLNNNKEKAQEAAFEMIIDAMANYDGTISTLRAAPLQIFNPFKGVSSIPDWLRNRQYLTFIDAGLDNNVPLRPLFDPWRSVDIIIVNEASGNALEAMDELERELAAMRPELRVSYELDRTVYQDHERYGYVSPRVMRVYRPIDATSAPLVIGVTYAKDPDLIAHVQQSDDLELQELIEQTHITDFDPEVCLQSTCGTFNFNYTAEQFTQLSGVVEFNLRAHHQLLRELIKERTK
ncbi:MAG: hypothetical protein WCE21_01840 [Candidatus Babeliales bacterium]